MIVFATGIHIQVAQQLSSQTVLGKHTLNYSLHQLFSTVGLCQDGSRGGFTLTTGITGIPQVNLVGHLVTCKYDFVCVDDDDVITAVYVRGEVGFVLTSQQLCNFRTETAYDLVGSIHNDPFFVRCFLVCRNGLVT